MNLPDVINGSEQPTLWSDEIGALSRFYHAFNQRDLALMQQNWTQSTEASMSNPLGGVMRGWVGIEQVYRRLFTGTARVYVEYYDFTVHTTANMFIAVGRERGWLQHGDERVELAIRTSRIFRKDNGLWCQLHHHGSMDDPALLAHYQSTVRSGKS
ncbi:MAG: nuclear transport factor 2 family protein [Gammaproteobacteria bacterium]|nr:nuclear transport factor 2 family protein [Gammaproteobacteria bacterium]